MLNNVWFQVNDFCKEDASINTLIDKLRNSTRYRESHRLFRTTLPLHTSLSLNTIVSSLAAGQPIYCDWTYYYNLVSYIDCLANCLYGLLLCMGTFTDTPVTLPFIFDRYCFSGRTPRGIKNSWVIIPLRQPLQGITGGLNFSRRMNCLGRPP